MHHSYPLIATLLLACGLAGCSSTASTSATRSTGHFAYAKPAPASDNSRVATVVAQPQQGGTGPANVAHIVYFDFDSYTVRPNDHGTLERHASWLRANPQKSLRLQGHTDVRGGIEYNLALGQKRAEAVRKNLEQLGAKTQQIEAVSYGKELLADPGTSEEAHQLNRRAEFEYR